MLELLILHYITGVIVVLGMVVYTTTKEKTWRDATWRGVARLGGLALLSWPLIVWAALEKEV